MPHIDRDAASLLLRDSPPEYDPNDPDSRHDVMSEFEIDDPLEVASDKDWFSSLKRFGTERIKRPVSRVIDPIAQLWQLCIRRIEERISRHMNLAIAKRFMVLIVVTAIAVVSSHVYFNDNDSLSDQKNHIRLKSLVREAISIDNIRETTEFLAKMPHYAGSQADLASATYAYDTFRSFGMGTYFDRHEVFLSHGNSTFFEIISDIDDSVVFTSTFTEGEALHTGELSQKQPPTQMSMILPGEAVGRLVYANFGSEADFAAIDCKDTIALVKMGHESPGDIAMRASSMGVRGLLFMANKVDPNEPSWPEGRDYPYDAIPQGSLGWPAIFPGDILSPGWPSSDAMVLSLSAAYIAKIPAAAISWNDAERIMQSLQGWGKRADTELGSEWSNNGVPAGVQEWWTGPNLNTTVTLITNPVAEHRHQIQNVFGQIKGRDEPDRVVVVGARIDAMCYGTSQLAGYNVILEVARVLSEVKRKERWDPLRSIFFTLWDGTAHNFAGATEWTEGVSKSLGMDGITYIDLDVGISGPELQIRGNPIFEMDTILKAVNAASPEDGTITSSLKEHSNITPVSGYGNHIAFEAHAGVPTLQLGFVDPMHVGPWDSCYDSIEWMHKYGDPNWERHQQLTQIVADLVIDIADAPILPYNFTQLSNSITDHTWYIKDRIDQAFGADIFDTDRDLHDRLNKILVAAHTLMEVGSLFEEAKSEWLQYEDMNRDTVTGDVPEVLPVTRMRHYWNERANNAVKGLIDINGIVERNWYKNHYLGPTRNPQYADLLSGVFPGIQDSIDRRARDDLLEAMQDVEAHVKLVAIRLEDLMYR